MKNFLMAIIFFFPLFIVSCDFEDSSEPTEGQPDSPEASQEMGAEAPSESSSDSERDFAESLTEPAPDESPPAAPPAPPAAPPAPPVASPAPPAAPPVPPVASPAPPAASPAPASDPSAPVRTVTCSSGSNQIVFKLYKPWTADNGDRYLCYLIDSQSNVLAYARNQEDYCETNGRNGLQFYISRWTNRGYTCS